MVLYEYSGYVYRKRKQDVKNKLKFQRRIVARAIKDISFNKRKTKYGWKFKAIVEKRRRK